MFYGNQDPSKVFIIYNVDTLKQLDGYKLYSSQRTAKMALTMAIKAKRASAEKYKVTDLKTFNEEIDHMVETTNILSGAKVMIRKSELGSCTDPGTERYHQM